jgi:hypothetical protein
MDTPDVFERFNTAAPIGNDGLLGIFGTTRPTAAEIEAILIESGKSSSEVDIDALNKRDRFWKQIGRGHCRYIGAYLDDAPDQIIFAGFSFD